jgi:3-methyladenine DNA glycosylase AlkD
MDGASAPHSEDVQRFFKEEVASRGWYTAELRKVAYRFHRVLLKEHGLDYLVSVADQLYRGRVLEEKNMAVMLLERSVHECGRKQFRLFDQWLDRVTNWADHDALLHYLIGPMIVDHPSRAHRVFVWACSRNRWRRRASAVALIRGARRRMFGNEIARLSEMLLDDEDDMVQKGLGWLLREYAKVDPQSAVRLLMKLRARTPRLVLRTACETLDAKTKAKVLAKSAANSW